VNAIAILLAVEAGIAGCLFLGCRRDWNHTSVYLIAVTAPLEVYRTSVGGISLSLFRLSLAFGLIVSLASSRGSPTGAPRRYAALVRSRLGVAYLLITLDFAVSYVIHPVNPFLGGRLIATALIALVAIVITADVVLRSTFAHFARAFALGSALPILAGAWQALAPALGTTAQLPLLGNLPLAAGLEVSREPPAGINGLAARTKGSFGDPNHYGVYLMIVLGFALALAITAYLKRNQRDLTAYAAVTVAACAGLLTSYSRTAWLGAAVATLVAGTLAIRAERSGHLSRRAIATAAAVALAALAALSPGIPNVLARLNSRAAVNATSDSAHTHSVTVAYDTFTAAPEIGAGPGSLGTRLHDPQRTSVADSTYLTAAAERGGLGVAFLIAAAVVALMTLVQMLRDSLTPGDRLLVSGLLATYVGFIVSNATYDLWWDDYHWVVLGAMASLAARPFVRLRALGVKLEASDTASHPAV